MGLAPTAAQALPTGTPDPSAFATNGNVNAVVHGGGLTYIGGDFTELRAITGSHARLDPVTGKRAAPSPVSSGSVQAVIPDGAGGVYIGGGFSTVGNVNRHRVAHVLADGSVDPNFNPPLFEGPANRVLALALGSDGALYVGGDFNGVGGMPRGNIAKLSATSGNLFTTWNPNATHSTVEAVVTALAVSGSELFVGGIYDNIGGLARDSIAKLSTASGNAFSGWNPDPEGTDSFPTLPQTKALVVSGGNLFVGGLFKKIGGLDRNNIAKLSTVSGNAFSGFDPNSNQGGSAGTAEVPALALSDDATQLYAGGNFNNIGGLDRNAIAKLSATSGNAFSTWDPNAMSGGFQGNVTGIAVSGDVVYAGGQFEQIGGLARHGAAKLSATSGNAFSLFNVNPRLAGGGAGQIFTVAFSGGRPYIGGTLDSVNNVTRNHVAALDANGIPTDFHPVDVGANGEVSALDLNDDGTQLFVGGKFTAIGDVPREKVAKVSTVSGDTFESFDAGPIAGGTTNDVNALELSGGNLFVTGDFKQIGGGEPGGLAKLSSVTGDRDGAFTPDPSGPVNALKASADGSQLFVGGGFTDIGGQTHDHLAKLSVASGNAFAAWSPSPDQPVRALELAGSELYVGGEFLNIGGQARNRLAKVSTSNPGNAFSAWNPDVDAPVNTLGLVPGTSVLYAGGEFGGVNNATEFRNRLAAFSTTSGNVFSAFQPQTQGEVFSLAPSPTGVVMGQAVSGDPKFFRGYSQYTEPSPR